MSTKKSALLHEARVASENYARASKQLSDAKALNAMGVRTELLALAAIEHTAYHRWHRAIAAFNTCI